MATNRPKYTSVYKIDGISILPPLMTPEKRREMMVFKELAIQLENTRKNQRSLQQTSSSSFGLEQSCNLLRHGHSHIPQLSTTTRKQAVSEPSSSTSVTPSKRDRMEKLRKTETLVYDNRANSIILTLEGFEEETDFQSTMLERPQKLDQNDNKISPEVSKTPTKPEPSSPIFSRPKPYAAFIPIPSICVNPPTPSVQNNPICTSTASKRLCVSPTLKPDRGTGLIRSNSFTLEGPSNALLEHIKNQKLKKSTATQDTIESKAKRVQKVEPKIKGKSPSSPSLSHYSNSSAHFRSKRSPYDPKSTSKTKLNRKLKATKSVTTQNKPTTTNISSLSMPTPRYTSNLDYLQEIEDQHRARFIELIQQQQMEQKRLHKEFQNQQKLLLEQLSASVNKVQINEIGSPPSLSIHTESIQSTPSVSPEQESSSSARITPRRCLFLDINEPPTSLTRDASPSPQSTGRRVSFE